VNAHVLDFIGRHKDKPFLLYYPMMLTHDPYQPTPDSPDWDPKAVGESVNRKDAHFGEMVTYMDKLVGTVVAKLDECGLREKTLVILVGDNGTGKGTRSMMGTREVIGKKGSTVDAGMRVPLIASWPGRIAKGTVCRDLVDTTDFLPTICEAAALKVPGPLDGRSFLPQMCGGKGKPREWIYSWYSPRQGNDRSVREFAFNHRFKLYRGGGFFDLAKDLDEKSPLPVSSLAGEAAEAAQALQAALDQFKDARPAELPR
jgi:arylsulfatase A